MQDSEAVRVCRTFEGKVRAEADRLRGTGQGRQLAAALLLIRVFEYFTSCIDLLEKRRFAAARVMLRALLEVVFTTRAVMASDETYDQWLGQDEIQRARLIKLVRRHAPDSLANLRDSMESAPLEEIEAEIERQGTKPLKVFELARRANMVASYVTAYPILSSTIHAQLRDLDNHVVFSDDGQIRGLRTEEDSTDLTGLAASALEMLTLGAQAAFDPFDAGFSASLLAEASRIQEAFRDEDENGPLQRDDANT